MILYISNKTLSRALTRLSFSTLVHVLRMRPIVKSLKRSEIWFLLLERENKTQRYMNKMHII